MTEWEDGIKVSYAELAGKLDTMGDISSSMFASGFSPETMRAFLDHLTGSQAVMLATNNLYFVMACVYFIAAAVIWLTPRPSKVIDTSGVH